MDVQAPVRLTIILALVLTLARLEATLPVEPLVLLSVPLPCGVSVTAPIRRAVVRAVALTTAPTSVAVEVAGPADSALSSLLHGYP